ncbi:hypothetical protein AB0I28_00600 [Phytomonospora sp. NPDC050363]|uniref:hypothetical protein n=1 Tax=Phytomonospora sp. NPDC050363 TaxID=3155642 RepID=UPI0033E2985A
MTVPLPVLWLTGPAGVGKTTAAWRIHTELGREGVPAAFVDIDQLGMCYPARDEDPDRHLLKAANLAAVLRGHRAAGARCVVVSGVVDSAEGVDEGLLPGAALTMYRLRAGTEALVERFTGREGAAEEVVAQVLREAAALDASGIGYHVLDTTGLSADEVVRRVRDDIGDWPGELGAAGPVPPAPTAGADGPILWVSGVTGVGKSTVGFGLYLKALACGPAAYVDVDQLGLSGTVADDEDAHRLKAANLAAVWRNHRAAGARSLTVVGQMGDESTRGVYREALPEADLTVCRLHADRTRLTERILARGRGEGWPQPGDPLVGREPAYLRELASRASAEAEALERAGFGDLSADTSGRTAAEVAEIVASEAGWPRSE